MIVAVFGSAGPREGSSDYTQAYELGFALGRQGHTVMTGGYFGVMQAAAQGALDGGGKTIGVTCADIDSWRPTGPNPFIQDHRSTPNLNSRLEVLVREADAFFALPGGIGTMGEIILALNLMAVNSMPVKPLIAIGNAWQKTFDAFFNACAPQIASKDKALLVCAPDVPQALAEFSKMINRG